MLRRIITGLVIVMAGTVLAQPVRQVSKNFTPPKFGSQNQFIESAILKDTALMLVYAKTGQPAAVDVTWMGVSPEGATAYRLTLLSNVVNVELAANLPIWEPGRYDDAVAKMATIMGVRPTVPRSRPRQDILQELANPRLETLATISDDLSRNLAEQMLDATIHEQAALLLAAFALRERLEPVDDVRWALNRLTAHLAVAHWCAGTEPGIEAQYALASAYALMNLQTNALERVRWLGTQPQQNLHWNRALFARITGDYRPLQTAPAESLSLLEWEERIYAISRSVGQQAAVKELRKFLKVTGGKDPGSDVCFCIFQGELPDSVSMGRALYLEPLLAMTLKDLALVSRVNGHALLKINTPDELATRLNVEPGPCVHSEGQVRIVDWGAWAMQFQRRLAIYYARSLRFMEHQWGLPAAEVAQEKRQLDKVLGKLWLVPCLAGAFGDTAQLARAHELFVARPQVVPISAALDMIFNHSTQFATGRHSMDDPQFAQYLGELQYAPDFPTGTFLGFNGVIQYYDWSSDPKLAVRQMPYSSVAAHRYIRRLHPPALEVRELLKNLSEYDTYAGRQVADSYSSEQLVAKEVVYQKIAEQDPDYYRTLFYLFLTNDPAKAAGYFEKAREGGADPVGNANAAKPVVLYFLATGNQAKAKEIAEEACLTGSALGFEAMQAYCVKTHDYDRGLTAAQDEEDRYGDDDVVLNYLEMVRKEPPGYHGFDKLYEQRLARFNSADFITYQPTTAPPVCGVKLVDAGRTLRAGDIIVAVDGKAVRTSRELRNLRRRYSRKTGDEQNIPMTVYRGGRYLEIKDTTAFLCVIEFGDPAAARASGSVQIVGSGTQASSSTAIAFSRTSSGPPREAASLRLNGVSGPPSNRLAIINGKTLAAGESATVKLAGHAVTFRCLSITERSAKVIIDGGPGPEELFLSDAVPAAGK